MDEAVDSRERHGLIGEDFAPLAERLVGRDQHGSPLISRCDRLEQHAGLGLILGDVGDVVEDEEVVAGSSTLHAAFGAQLDREFSV